MGQLEGVDVRHAVESSPAKDWLRRVLLVITTADSVSESLVCAIEREFPLLTVEQVPTLEAGCTRFEYPVALVLIDATMLPEIDGHSAMLTRCHPTAPFALMRSDDRVPIAVQDLLATGILRGVLPMNLKLDVWLSVVRLIMRGGEHFPVALFQTYINGTAAEAEEIETTLANELSEEMVAGLEALTDRERQILEMVSRGMQNKNIASALGLSEYTVKIHLHHIITKLGAHNRTQAAAIFHDSRASLNRNVDDRQPN
jgi:RNA polymerase sigma factor (sigma-70 family)